MKKQLKPTGFIFLLFLAVLFGGCTPEVTVHEHSFETGWTSNDDYHWQKADCGHDEIKNKGEHVWSDGVITKEGSQTGYGEKTYTCQVCGKKRVEVVHFHKFSGEWTLDEDYHWHKATCGHDLISEKAGHEWDKGKITQEASETEYGIKTYTCGVCGFQKTEKLPKIQHTHEFSNKWTADDNSHWHAAVCGHDLNSDEGKHIWIPGESQNQGEKVFVCSVCGEQKKIVVHTHTYSEAWTKDENNHWHVATCGHDTEISGKAAHSWDNGRVTKEPNCSETGVKTYTCTVCDQTKEENLATAHSWDNGRVTKEPNCSETGVKTYTCTVCGQTKEENLATAHSWDNAVINGSKIFFVCSLCNYTDEYENKFHEVPEKTGTKTIDGKTYDIITFGDWPRTLKAENVTVDESKTLVMGGNTYYLGSDLYYYAKCKENAFDSNYKYSDNKTTVNQSSAGSYKYFKVEPIKWRVLESKNGKSLILAEEILTANVPYYASVDDRTISGKTVYPNNYRYSTIRAYLNGKYESNDTQAKTYNGTGFLQSAFTESAQELINTTTVKNAAVSTTDTGNNITKATSYICEDTEDKVFLLSEYEVTDSAYGFTAYDKYGAGNSRIRVTTDYAKANYAWLSTITGDGGYWWLRSPYYDFSYIAHLVGNDGYADRYSFSVLDEDNGVVPALSILY